MRHLSKFSNLSLLSLALPSLYLSAIGSPQTCSQKNFFKKNLALSLLPPPTLTSSHSHWNSHRFKKYWIPVSQDLTSQALSLSLSLSYYLFSDLSLSLSAPTVAGNHHHPSLLGFLNIVFSPSLCEFFLLRIELLGAVIPIVVADVAAKGHHNLPLTLRFNFFFPVLMIF